MQQTVVKSWAQTGALVVGLGLAGCIQHRDPFAARRVGQPQPATQAQQPRGGPQGGSSTQSTAPVELPPAIVRSELRERAILLLEAMTLDPSPQVRANAIEGLEVVPARLAAAVGPATQDSNEGVRSVAALAIGRNRLCEQIALVRPLAEDRSAYARVAAAFALARCGDTSTINTLADHLFRHPEVRVRSLAAYALGELGDPSAAPMLRQAADVELPRTSDIELRVFDLQIAEALFKLGEFESLDTLHTALFPSRPEELEATALAAQILGEVGSRRSLPDLRNLIAYRDELGNAMPAEVQLAAAAARAKLGMSDAGWVAYDQIANPSAVIRSQAALTLGELEGDDQLDELARLLDDPNPLVQVAAATAVLRVFADDGFSDGR